MKKSAYLTICLITVANALNAGPLTVPHEFQSGEAALASEVNENFQAVKTAVDDNNTRIEARQNRVTGACEVGSAIRSIAEDGSVVCQTSTVANVPYRVFLQDGLDSYSGTSDTTIYKVPDDANPEPGTRSLIYSEYQADETNGRLALIRFDVSSLVSNAESFVQQFNPTYAVSDCSTQISVKNAKLQVLGIPGGGTTGTTPAFLLRYFAETAPLFEELTANWDNANASSTWNKSGTTVETFEDLVGGVFDAKDIPNSSYGRIYTFHVEPTIVKSWICDSTLNKGMAIEMAGGGTGGSMRFFSRESTVQERRPMLIIDIGLN